jgi:hypothetical protein
MALLIFGSDSPRRTENLATSVSGKADRTESSNELDMVVGIFKRVCNSFGNNNATIFQAGLSQFGGWFFPMAYEIRHA